VTTRIVRLAARGDGITDDGRYVPGATIDDEVIFEGDTPRIRPGPRHMMPVCRHVPACGGCQMQHVSDEDYTAFVLDRLRHVLGPLMPADIAPVALSPARSRRRASLRAVRRGGQLRLGFNAESSHQIVDIRQCEILRPELFALIDPLRQLLKQALADGQGAGITLTLSETGLDVLLANVRAEHLDEIERLTDFARTHDLARLSVEGADGVQTIVEARTPSLTMGGVRVGLPPAPFLQPSGEGEAALVSAVLVALGSATHVADLFCGLGTFALPISARARVLAADAAGPAVAAMAMAARAAGRPVTPLHRDLFRRPLAPAELAPLEALVFDPPRAGAEAQCRQIAAARVPVVVAVSCNPSTFGRDARLLADGGYVIDKLWPVAQFRWSSHIELVARFVHRADG
jgi:23S rRNA (uracil1939-C5)-methyltransferase